MNPRSVGPLWAIIGMGALAACDATEPVIERTLRVRGIVLEGYEAPFTPIPPLIPLRVTVETWVPGLSPGTFAVETDAQGHYAVTLGPTLATHIDSIRVRVTQFSCQRTFTTVLTHRYLDAAARDTLTLPSISLDLPWTPAQASTGGSSCAVIDVPTPAEGGLGDFMMLALWHDDLGDQPRGRWRLNHQASIGDDFGYFDGVRTEAGLDLILHSNSPECGAFALRIPVGGVNNVTFGAAELTNSGNCFVPQSMQLRFFDGAVLSDPPVGD